MSLTIPDSVLKSAGLSEREGQVEIACRWFDSGRLTKAAAAKWLGMNRTEFEEELFKRSIPLYRLTEDDLEQDLAALRRLGK
jgi:predicted HTH domain antitoxin